MDLNLSRRVLNLKIDGEAYVVRFPTVKDVKAFSKADGDDYDNTVNLLDGLGLKKEVVETLELEHVAQIVDVLMGQKKTS